MLPSEIKRIRAQIEKRKQSYNLTPFKDEILDNYTLIDQYIESDSTQPIEKISKYGFNFVMSKTEFVNEIFPIVPDLQNVYEPDVLINHKCIDSIEASHQLDIYECLDHTDFETYLTGYLYYILENFESKLIEPLIGQLDESETLIEVKIKGEELIIEVFYQSVVSEDELKNEYLQDRAYLMAEY